MYKFTATDRCDGCGARAHHIARKSGFADLTLCNHCWKQHHDKLLDTYWLIESDMSTEPVMAVTYKE